MPNIASLIRNHVSLSISCLDRLYINGYVPTLQTSNHLWFFLRKHLGYLIPSPAVIRPLHDRFIAEIKTFASKNHLPVVQFERGRRKDDIAAWYRARSRKSEGTIFIGVAQEKASSFKAQKTLGPKGGVHFEFSRQPVAVNHYYFYLQDKE